jgi:hypothetical protein
MLVNLLGFIFVYYIIHVKLVTFKTKTIINLDVKWVTFKNKTIINLDSRSMLSSSTAENES